MPTSHPRGLLVWVDVAGELRRVDEFAGLAPGARPDATCPQCGQPVTMKLGPRNMWHAAHGRGAMCASSAPESALHLNAKFLLARELETAPTLRLLVACRHAQRTRRPCDVEVLASFDVVWTDVHVERTVGSLRPDIVLLRGGRAVGAIEVFASHAVDAAKSAVLADMGLPWLEVRASDVAPSDGPAWRPDDLLPVHARGPEANPLCVVCAHAEANGLHPRVERVVDFLHPSGAHFRDFYTVMEERKDGHIVALILTSEHGEDHVRFAGPPDDTTMRRIQEAYLRLLQRHSSPTTIVDSPMRWRRPADPAAEGSDDCPVRYVWDPQRDEWVLDPRHERTRWYE